jgi:hypothetical protein
MPQRDFYHRAVRQALVADGWTITHDPYFLSFGGNKGFIDLGAEIPLAAERDERRIAVEIKSFVGRSVVNDLADALGQYTLYKSWLLRKDPARLLYLAVDQEVAHANFADISIQVLIEDYQIRLLVVNAITERIVEWREPPPIGS